MKKFLTILLFIPCLLRGQAKYYVKASGSDGNAGTSSTLAWATLAKACTTPVAGDSVFVNGGDVFNETFRPKTGVVYTSYGTGKFVVGGFVTLTGWTSVGGGVYQSTCSGCTPSTSMLLMNGSQQPFARYPNTGYLTYQSFSGTTSITSSSLTGTPNWTNGYVAIRAFNAGLGVHKITAQSGGTITYTNATGWTPAANFGFFILNDSLALDTLGEYIPGPGYIKMFFGGASPASYLVQVPNRDTLVSFPNGSKNITIINMDAEGANVIGLYGDNDTSIVINNSVVAFSGGTGQQLNRCVNCRITNTTVRRCNENGIMIGDSSKNAYVGMNDVRHIGVIPGQGTYRQGDSYKGINTRGVKTITELNRVHAIGYDGILGYNDSSISYNVIDSTNFVTDDGAGIYHLGYDADTTRVHLIRGNVIWNAVGAAAGTNNLSFAPAYGIYADNNNTGCNVDSNTIYSCAQAGIFFHNTRRSNITNNNVYACKYQLDFQGDDATKPIRANTIKHNVLGLANSSQSLWNIASFNNIYFTKTIGAIDSNAYGYTNLSSTPFQYYPPLSQTYKQWGDSITETNTTILNAPDAFAVNTGSSAMALRSNPCYGDAAGTNYVGNSSIPRYSSKLLFLKSPCTLPSPDVSIWDLSRIAVDIQPSVALTPHSFVFANTAGSASTSRSLSYTFYSTPVSADTITTPSGFEASIDNGSNWATTFNGIASGTGSALIRVAASTAAGTYAGNVVLKSKTTKAVYVSAVVSSGGSLSASPSSITGLNGTAGSAGTAQTVMVTFAGTMVTATPPSSTEISQDGGGTYNAVSQVFSTGSPLSLKIRTTAAASAGSVSGNLHLSGTGGATAVDVPVTGTISAVSSALFNFSASASTVSGATNAFGDPTASPTFTDGTTGWQVKMQGANWVKFGGSNYGGVANGATAASGDGIFTMAQINSNLYNINSYSSPAPQIIIDKSGGLAAGTYAIYLLGSIPTSVFDNSGNMEFHVVFGSGSDNHAYVDPNGKPASTGNITTSGPGTVTSGSFTGTITAGQTIKIWVTKGTAGGNLGALGYINALKIVKTN
ncbi:MAG TPA: hypothetical protein VGN00_14325 [Puia sp.]|jgi:parallel beta-helix repeat protein